MTVIVKTANKSGNRLFVWSNGVSIGGKASWKLDEIYTGIEHLEATKTPSKMSSFAKLWKKQATDTIEDLKKALDELSIPEPEEPEEEEEEELPEPSLDELKAKLERAGLEDFEYDIEVGIQTAICAGFPSIDCPPWVIMQAPPAAGKDFVCGFLDDTRISKISMKMTKNALSPGRANLDTEVMGVYTTVKNRMWIISELGILFRDEDSAVNFLYEMLGMYGKRRGYVDDPAGEQKVDTYFTTFFGGTKKMVDLLMSKITAFGPRYLILERLSRRKMIVPIDPEIRKEIRDLVTSIVLDRRKLPLPDITEEVREEAFKFASKFTLLRAASYATCPEEAEDTSRLQLVLENCSRLRAMLYKRFPKKEDIKWWQKCVYPTLGYRDSWKRIYERKPILKDVPGTPNWHRIIRNHLELMGIAGYESIPVSSGSAKEEFKLNDEWEPFVGEVITGLHFEPEAKEEPTEEDE